MFGFLDGILEYLPRRNSNEKGDPSLRTDIDYFQQYFSPTNISLTVHDLSGCMCSDLSENFPSKFAALGVFCL